MAPLKPLRYRVVVEPSDREGGYVAHVAAFKNLMTRGVTPEEAFQNALDAIDRRLGVLRDKGFAAPESTVRCSGRFVARVPPYLHYALARFAKREGVSLNTMVVALLAQSVGWRLGHATRRKAKATPKK